MNWKLIFSLSLFGIAMACLDTFTSIGKIEPLFWLIIFIFYGVIIVKNAPGKFFMHAFWTSVVNGVWIGIIHALYHDTYIAHNPQMADMEMNMPQLMNPQMTMVIFGPIIGAVFGVINGVITLIVAAVMKKKPAA